MRKRLVNSFAAVVLTATPMAAIAVTAISPAAQATFTTAVVSNAGVLQAGRDHFFELTVEGDPLQRVRVECVTFHELDGLEISVDGEAIEPSIHYGFEEFTLTFAEPIASGKTIRIVMNNSRVRGAINAGIDVPYRVYGTYPSLNDAEVPLGTAIVRTPRRGDN
ncbi:MAG: hypothetical protein F6K42_06770 [Leptolyngbya sp. SIO1D8]|nr:hypothetical protein [Leptolyngbya sp. SIO1D8]